MLFNHIFPGRYSAWTEKYRDLLISSYRKAVGRAEHPEIEPTPTNIFWSANVYVAEHSGVAFKYASHFVELYGFSRNAACGFLCLGILGLIRKWQVVTEDRVIIPHFCLSFFAFAIFYLLLHNYTKMYRRHNDQVLRSFIVAVGKVEEEKAESSIDNELQ